MHVGQGPSHFMYLPKVTFPRSPSFSVRTRTPFFTAPCHSDTVAGGTAQAAVQLRADLRASLRVSGDLSHREPMARGPKLTFNIKIILFSYFLKHTLN